MCLAVPGRVLEIYHEDDLRMGRIDFSGTVNRVCLDFVPEVQEGQYVIVHAGFAISLLDEDEAQQSLRTLEEFSRTSEGEAASETISASSTED